MAVEGGELHLKSVKSLGNEKENISVSSISRRKWEFFSMASFSSLLQLCLHIRVRLELKPFATVKL